MQIKQLSRLLNVQCELTHKVIALLNVIDFNIIPEKRMEKLGGVNEYICWIGSQAYITKEFEQFEEEYQLLCVLAECFSWEKYYQGEIKDSICLEMCLTGPPYAPRQCEYTDLEIIQQCVNFDIYDTIAKYRYHGLPKMTSQKATVFISQLIHEGDASLGEVDIKIATEKYCQATISCKSLTQVDNTKAPIKSNIFYDFRRKKLISSLSKGYKEFQKEIEIINSLTQGVG